MRSQARSRATRSTPRGVAIAAVRRQASSNPIMRNTAIARNLAAQRARLEAAVEFLLLFLFCGYPVHGEDSPCAASNCALITEPDGSVFYSPPGRLLRRALGRHPARRAGAARAFGRLDHRARGPFPHDPDGHEEARRRAGAGRLGHQREGGPRAHLPARPARPRGRGSLDRWPPPGLERTLRRPGRGGRGSETQGEARWARKLTTAAPGSNAGPIANWW